MISKLITMAAIFTATAAAQVPRGYGYVVQGVAGGIDFNDKFAATAFGGHGAVWKGITVGGEIGAIYTLGRYPARAGVGHLSAGYHFMSGRKDTKWDPYAVAGPTLAVGGGVAGGFHFAAGTNYWFHRRIGVKGEYRTGIISSDAARWNEARFGITFR